MIGVYLYHYKEVQTLFCRYSNIIGDNNSRQFAEAHSHHNVGMLQEILGNHKEALESYKKYCSLSKKKSDKKGIAQSYGCLGSVYASLGNRAMAVTYHEQHVSAAKKLGDMKLQIQAVEQMGDTYMKIKEYGKAAETYNKMYKLCPRTDIHTRTASLLKLGNSCKAQGKCQYALYYTEQAKTLAQENDFTNIEIISTLNLASILQHSTQVFELDQAKKYFQDLIPIIEVKIEQHRDEETFCSEELHSQLFECFDGIQTVLAKLGNYRECLVYAEASRQNLMTLKYSNNCLPTFSKGSIQESLDKIINFVHQQNSTVLYYTVLNNALLLWVLQPGIGIARFYAGKNNLADQTMPQQIEQLINNIRTIHSSSEKNQSFDCENRSLPLRDTDLEQIKRHNEKLSRRKSNTVEKEKRITTPQELDDKPLERQPSQVKSPQRKLFDLLLAPVDDFLSKLEDQATLVVVPDKVLHTCPIWTAIDWDNKPLNEYFRITVIPSLHLLDKVSRNEIKQLGIQDELQFERSQSRLGGIPKIISARGEGPGSELYPIEEAVSTTKEEDLDLKKTSNPRLITSGVLRSNSNVMAKRVDSSQESRESTQSGKKGRRSAVSIPSKIEEDPRPTITEPLKHTKVIGSPTTIAEMAGTHSFSTLTTRTSTTTDITSSYDSIPEFQQISDPYKCVAFGNPALPKRFV